MRRLEAAHVLVLGIGGLGSWEASMLAQIGVGCLTANDVDVVEASNLTRQIGFTERRRKGRQAKWTVPRNQDQGSVRTCCAKLFWQ